MKKLVFVLLILFAGVSVEASTPTTKLNSRKLSLTALCVGTLVGLYFLSKNSTIPKPIPPIDEQPAGNKTAQDAQPQESISKDIGSTSKEAELFKDLIAVNDSAPLQSPRETDTARRSWVLKLVKARSFRFTNEMWSNSSRNTLVQHFLEAVQNGDQLAAESFSDILEATDDWSPLDFFNTFEQITDEPGHQEWKATLLLPGTDEVWNISYKEIAGPPEDPESKETIVRVY